MIWLYAILKILFDRCDLDLQKATKGINRDDLFLTVKNMQESSGHFPTTVVFHLAFTQQYSCFLPYLKIEKNLRILWEIKGFVFCFVLFFFFSSLKIFNTCLFIYIQLVSSLYLGRFPLIKSRYRNLECSFWKGGKKKCPLDKSLNSVKCFPKLHIFLGCFLVFLSPWKMSKYTRKTGTGPYCSISVIVYLFLSPRFMAVTVLGRGVITRKKLKRPPPTFVVLTGQQQLQTSEPQHVRRARGSQGDATGLLQK